MYHSALLTLLLFAGAAASVEPFLLRDRDRVVFLGDSNTFAGHYIAYVDGYLRTRFPEQRFELLNLGLPSETITGESEPDHPYPRPNVHERLARVLSRTQPTVVVVCYGMNDGIYYPFSPERFAKYQAETRRLLEQVRKSGVERIVLLTPSPFDPTPLAAKVLPSTADKFSWMRPFRDYDGVLGRYSDWLLTLRKDGLPVGDPHTAVNRFLAEVRKDDPKFIISGDGIHPSPTGHAIVAAELLAVLNAPAEVDRAEIDAGTRKATAGKVSDLSIDGDRLAFAWETRLPMPVDPRWDRRLEPLTGLHGRVNRHVLRVRGLPADKYELFEGDRKVGSTTRAELEIGLDLLRLPELSTNRRSAEVGTLSAQRTQQLGLAWLTDVGHKRPDTPKGLPLAEAQKLADELDEKLRPLAKPVQLQLRLQAVK